MSFGSLRRYDLGSNVCRFTQQVINHHPQKVIFPMDDPVLLSNLSKITEQNIELKN